jgi:RNA polymerase sigma-70 factor (ECF subfamily)
VNREQTADAEFAEFYRRHFRQIYSYCLRRISPDRIDDAVADTFLVAWRRLSVVPEGASALPWLYGVAYKVLATQRRGRSRQEALKTKLAASGATPMTGIEDFVVTAEESQRVLDAMSRLKPTDQEILKLSVWEELPHSDIALVLEITPGAVKQRAYEARKNLTREFNRLENSRIGPLIAPKGGRR